MTAFYTNAAQRGSDFLISGYRNGEKVMNRVTYEPYLFVPGPEGSPYKNLQGEPLKKITFSNTKEAREFLKSRPTVYGNEKFLYNYLYDEYPGEIQYDYSIIKKAFLDIETKTPEAGGFPDPKVANEEVTVITVAINREFWTLSTKPFDINDERLEGVQVKFIKCQDERDLLQRFLQLWEAWSPDIITGWNVNGFDLLYLYNRLSRLLSPKSAARLSPWGAVDKREYQSYGKEQIELTLVGISILDYLELYKKFSYTPQPSYSLKQVSTYELGLTKIDYSEYDDLNDFWNRDPQGYIAYNIIDVLRVVQIDEKMDLLGMVCSFAYDAKINYNDAFATVLPWDRIITNHLMDKYIAVPKPTNNPDREIMGGYVKDTIPGMYEWVMSFDANSLYPHTQMWLNISPDTYVGCIRDVSPEGMLAGNIPYDPNYCTAANGAQFRKDKQGFLPEILEKKYNLRSWHKKKMLEWEKKLLQIEKELKKRGLG